MENGGAGGLSNMTKVGSFLTEGVLGGGGGGGGCGWGWGSEWR